MKKEEVESLSISLKETYDAILSKRKGAQKLWDWFEKIEFFRMPSPNFQEEYGMLREIYMLLFRMKNEESNFGTIKNETFNEAILVLALCQNLYIADMYKIKDDKICTKGISCKLPNEIKNIYFATKFLSLQKEEVEALAYTDWNTTPPNVFAYLIAEAVRYVEVTAGGAAK